MKRIFFKKYARLLLVDLWVKEREWWYLALSFRFSIIIFWNSSNTNKFELKLQLFSELLDLSDNLKVHTACCMSVVRLLTASSVSRSDLSFIYKFIFHLLYTEIVYDRLERRIVSGFWHMQVTEIVSKTVKYYKLKSKILLVERCMLLGIFQWKCQDLFLMRSANM